MGNEKKSDEQRDFEAAVYARIRQLNLSYSLRNDIVLPDVLKELAIWRAIAEITGKSLMNAADDKVRTNAIFDGMVKLLRRTLPKYKQGDNFSKSQRVKAQLPRTRDVLAELVKRTVYALQKAGKRTNPKAVIDALGKYDGNRDEKGTLRAATPTDEYGGPSNRLRAYTTGKGRDIVVYWTDGKSD